MIQRNWRRMVFTVIALSLTLGCGTCQVAGCVLGDVTQNYSYVDGGEGALWALAVVVIAFTVMLAALGSLMGGGGYR